MTKDTENINDLVYKNTIKYLYNISNITPNQPRSSQILKSFYSSKYRILEERGNVRLPETNTKNRCGRCCLELNDGQSTYRIRPEKHKSRFAKKVLRKEVSQLTSYQKEYCKRLPKTNVNYLISTCGFCKKEVKTEIAKRPKPTKTIEIPKKKNKKKHKNKNCGLTIDLTNSENENKKLNIVPAKDTPIIIDDFISLSCDQPKSVTQNSNNNKKINNVNSNKNQHKNNVQNSQPVKKFLDRGINKQRKRADIFKQKSKLYQMLNEISQPVNKLAEFFKASNS